MSDLERLHRAAMDFADEAALAAASGKAEESKRLYALALDSERQAAHLLAASLDLEPTRSVLFRSAASLALDCGQTREAERLAAQGLSGNPPDEIADELRDLLEQIHFHRHLELRGVVLHGADFQMTLAGSAIGFGTAPTDRFVSRVSDLDRLIYRTAERKLGRAFRDRGRRSGEVVKEVGTFISAPRAASFAVTVHIGYTPQLSLPGLDLPVAIVTEALDCLEAVQEGDSARLRRHIADDAYRRNFWALARRLAPDGIGITSVGFTSVLAGSKERRVLLTRPQALFATGHMPSADDNAPAVTIRGTLRFADATSTTKQEIRVVDSGGRKHRIRVPEGMMEDIVRPLWEYEVEVTAVPAGGVPTLTAIAKLDEGKEGTQR